jgi:hypothetical protein
VIELAAQGFLSMAPFGKTFDAGARIWIASWIESMARSAARAP